MKFIFDWGFTPDPLDKLESISQNPSWIFGGRRREWKSTEQENGII